MSDFVFVDEVVADIRWDAKYATWDNFTGKPVDGYRANRIVGSRELAEGLARASAEAKARGFGLLLWDGYRPQRAVDAFIRWSEQPEDGVKKQRHYPHIERADMFEQGYVATKSGHTRGGTVDLGLYWLNNDEVVDMGGDHDIMDPSSHHDAPVVSTEHTANRNALREIMKAAGFTEYAYEWWHYTLTDEPYPDTYFDFPITVPLVPVTPSP